MWLPFSLAFGIIPGPNLPLAFNAFRLYSHWRAKRGCESILLLHEQKRLQVVSDPSYSECFKGQNEDSKLSTQVIEKLCAHANNDEGLKEFLERSMHYMERKEVTSVVLNRSF